MPHMIFEKIAPPTAVELEAMHPAARAAHMIRQLHVENIEKIESGFVFYKIGEDGVSRSVNEQMSIACHEQIMQCDKIIASASQLERTSQFASIVNDIGPSMLPEIGDYEHKNS